MTEALRESHAIEHGTRTRRRVIELDHGTLVRDQARGVYGYGT